MVTTVHGRGVIALAVLVAILIPLSSVPAEIGASSVTVLQYTAPFTTSWTERGGAPPEILTASASSGGLQVFAAGRVSEGYANIGQEHHVRSGDTLPSTYSAKTLGTFDFHGIIYCGSTFDSATYRLIVERQRLDGSTWTTLDSTNAGNSCGGQVGSGGGTYSENDYAVSLGTLQYEKGKTYRLVGKFHYKTASTFDENANVVFCKSSYFMYCHGDVGVVVKTLAVDNQAPISRFNGQYVTFVDQVRGGGALISGKTCDFETTITTLRVHISDSTAGDETRSFSASSACSSGSFRHIFAAPGQYYGYAQGQDNLGRTGGSSGGYVHVTLAIPDSTLYGGTSASDLGDVVTIEHAFGDENKVVMTEVISDESTLSTHGDPDAPVNATSRTVWNRETSRVDLYVDDVLEWSGDVIACGDDWWELQPVGTKSCESMAEDGGPYTEAEAWYKEQQASGA